MKGALSAATEVFRNTTLRRAQAAWALHLTAESAYLVALGLFAYRAGGGHAVGLAGLVLMLPGAVAAPFAAGVADRFRREHVVLATGFVRSLLLAMTAASVVADLPAAWIYGLAALGSVAASVFRPAYTALVPSLARSPRELIAANVAASTTEGLAAFVGPASAGVLFAVAGGAPVFALAACAFFASGLAVAGIDSERQPVPNTRHSAEEALCGIRRASADRHVRVLLGCSRRRPSFAARSTR